MDYLLIEELKARDKRIEELEYIFISLKSQLLDVHSEDSLIITIINNALNKQNE